MEECNADAAPLLAEEECKPVGLDDFDLLHVIGQVVPAALRAQFHVLDLTICRVALAKCIRLDTEKAAIY